MAVWWCRFTMAWWCTKCSTHAGVYCKTRHFWSAKLCSVYFEVHKYAIYSLKMGSSSFFSVNVIIFLTFSFFSVKNNIFWTFSFFGLNMNVILIFSFFSFFGVNINIFLTFSVFLVNINFCLHFFLQDNINLYKCLDKYFVTTVNIKQVNFWLAWLTALCFPNSWIL